MGSRDSSGSVDRESQKGQSRTQAPSTLNLRGESLSLHHRGALRLHWEVKERERREWRIGQEEENSRTNEQEKITKRLIKRPRRWKSFTFRVSRGE